MKLEVLYSNVANLYGDLYNVTFLKETLKDSIEIIYTEFGDRPYFADNNVDMIYIGTMMERFQEKIIEELKPFANRIKQLIYNDVVFLSTGNSLEIFGDHIDDLEGLKIFNYYSHRDFSHHHNSCFLGKMDDIVITGFKSTFSYTSNIKSHLFEVDKGFGDFDDKSHEGIRSHNFFGTYLIGPVLILNPDFTHYLLKLLKCDCELAFENDAKDAFDIRLEEYQKYEDFKEFKH